MRRPVVRLREKPARRIDNVHRTSDRQIPLAHATRRCSKWPNRLAPTASFPPFLADLSRLLKPLVPFDFISLTLIDHKERVVRLHILETDAARDGQAAGRHAVRPDADNGCARDAPAVLHTRCGRRRPFPDHSRVFCRPTASSRPASCRSSRRSGRSAACTSVRSPRMPTRRRTSNSWDRWRARSRSRWIMRSTRKLPWLTKRSWPTTATACAPCSKSTTRWSPAWRRASCFGAIAGSLRRTIRAGLRQPADLRSRSRRPCICRCSIFPTVRAPSARTRSCRSTTAWPATSFAPNEGRVFSLEEARAVSATTVALFDREGIQSLCSVPLLSRGTALGTMNVGSDGPTGSTPTISSSLHAGRRPGRHCARQRALLQAHRGTE